MAPKAKYALGEKFIMEAGRRQDQPVYIDVMEIVTIEPDPINTLHTVIQLKTGTIVTLDQPPAIVFENIFVV